MFCAMVSGFDNVHIRGNLPRLEQAIKYGNSAGDKFVCISFKLYISPDLFHQNIHELWLNTEHYNPALRL